MKMKATCSMRGNLPLTRVKEGSDALMPRLSRRQKHDGDMPLNFYGGDIVDTVKLRYPKAVVEYLVGRGVLIESSEEKPDDNEAAEDLAQGSVQGLTQVSAGLADGEENTASPDSVAGAGSAVATNDKEAEVFE